MAHLCALWWFVDLQQSNKHAAIIGIVHIVASHVLSKNIGGSFGDLKCWPINTNSTSGLSPVVAVNVRSMRRKGITMRGLTNYSRMLEQKLSVRWTIGHMSRLPNVRRKRANTLIRISLRRFCQEMRVKYPPGIKLVGIRASDFHVRMLVLRSDRNTGFLKSKTLQRYPGM